MIIYINKKDRIAISDRYINNKVGKHDYNGIEYGVFRYEYDEDITIRSKEEVYNYKLIDILLCRKNWISIGISDRIINNAISTKKGGMFIEKELYETNLYNDIPYEFIRIIKRSLYLI